MHHTLHFGWVTVTQRARPVDDLQNFLCVEGLDPKEMTARTLQTRGAHQRTPTQVQS